MGHHDGRHVVEVHRVTELFRQAEKGVGPAGIDRQSGQRFENRAVKAFPLVNNITIHVDKHRD